MHQDIVDKILDLSDSEATVYLIILFVHWHFPKGGCRWTYKHMARQAGVHYQTVYHSVKQLAEKKLISKKTERFGPGMGAKVTLKIRHMKFWQDRRSNYPFIDQLFQDVRNTVVKPKTKNSNQPEGLFIFTYSKYLLKNLMLQPKGFSMSPDGDTLPSSRKEELGMIRTAPVKRKPVKLSKERIEQLVLASNKVLPVESPEAVAWVRSLTPAQLKRVTAPTKDELEGLRHWAVEYWNHLDTPVKHPDPTTKAYKTAARYFDELEAGKFVLCKAKKRRENLIGFCKAGKFPYKVYHWRQGDIVTALKHLAINFQIKPWSRLSKKIPRSLHGLLYNPHTKTEFFSYFLYSAYYHESVKERVLKMKDEEPIEDFVLYLPKPGRVDKRRMRAGNIPHRDPRTLDRDPTLPPTPEEAKELGFEWLDLDGESEEEKTTNTSEG